MRRSVAALVSAFVAAATLAPSHPGLTAAGTIDSITGPANRPGSAALAAAERIVGLTEVVTIFNKANALDAVVQGKAVAAAEAAGAAWALGRGATVGLRTVRRGQAVVKAAPSGFQFPMAFTALPINAVGPLLGPALSSVLGNGQIVMSAKSAALNNARAGDVIDLVADDGLIRSFTIGMVADDALVGGTELLFTTAMADDLGVVIETRIVLWGFASRGIIDAGLAAQGLTTRTDTRIRRSWDPVDPDGTLGLASTKRLLGEFAYHVSTDDALTLTSDWIATFLPPDGEIFVVDIPIRARCNLRIKADLTAALTEVAQAGLAGAIDVDNANTYGGCFNPRFSRMGAAIGTVSRHSWAGALDTNTVTNAQGAVPQMNCDVVRIFRKHNFAWGGNFLTSDGMHFEWVGSRRDQLQYPSKYCPNVPPIGGAEHVPDTRPALTAEGTAQESASQPSRGTLFADDGWGGE